MSLVMVRATVKEQFVAELEAVVQKVYAALAEAAPTGIRYTSCKQEDGVTFVALLQLDEGVENPLPGFPAFQEMQAKLPGWLAAPPAVEPLGVVGSYGFFD